MADGQRKTPHDRLADRPPERRCARRCAIDADDDTVLVHRSQSSLIMRGGRPARIRQNVSAAMVTMTVPSVARVIMAGGGWREKVRRVKGNTNSKPSPVARPAMRAARAAFSGRAMSMSTQRLMANRASIAAVRDWAVATPGAALAIA